MKWMAKQMNQQEGGLMDGWMNNKGFGSRKHNKDLGFGSRINNNCCTAAGWGGDLGPGRLKRLWSQM